MSGEGSAECSARVCDGHRIADDRPHLREHAADRVRQEAEMALPDVEGLDRVGDRRRVVMPQRFELLGGKRGVVMNGLSGIIDDACHGRCPATAMPGNKPGSLPQPEAAHQPGGARGQRRSFFAGSTLPSSPPVGEGWGGLMKSWS